ncbi:MAG: Alpha-D-kanosaminyltransferase [Gemmatimonadetes bacterium]|nr:Alpha-D-kanosaminyltransferase [Gemmatimonadota bacterium]
MRVWLVTVGEPLPSDPGNERLLRAGIVADMLVARGHEVVWWSSTFNHPLKTFRATSDVTIHVRPNYRIELLHGGGYPRNVSLKRVRDHRRLAARFHARAQRQERPDVILCSLPPLELALAAVEYGQRLRVPVVVDVRDLWPDIFIDVIPRPLRPLARVAMQPLEAIAQQACTGATAIWGHAAAFVDWGLQHASRTATTLDRTFPFGYVSTEPTAAEITQSVQTWRTLGVARENEKLIACFVGTVGQQTDVASLVDTARLLGTNPRVQIVICGTGTRLDELMQRSKGLTNIIFAGWRQRPEIWTLLRMASVGVAPYVARKDFINTIPNKVPEYLSAGLPVALNLTSGVMYDLLLREGCGFSYENSPARFAEQLMALDNEPARLQAMRIEALRVFNERFLAERVYGDMITALEQIAAQELLSSRLSP